MAFSDADLDTLLEQAAAPQFSDQQLDNLLSEATPDMGLVKEAARFVTTPPETLRRGARRKELEREGDELLKERQRLTPEKLPVAIESARTLGAAQIHRAMAGILSAVGIKSGAQEARDIGAEREAESKELSEMIGAGSATELLRQLGGTTVGSMPALAAGPAGISGIAATAGLQQFGSTFEDATEAYMAQGVPEEDARKRAYIPAAVSGLITAGLTRTMSGGAERLAQDVLSGKVTRETAAKLISRSVMGALEEIPEEFADQIGQGIVAKLSYDPDKDIRDIWGEAVNAGIAGALSAGVVGGAGVVTSGAVRGVEGVRRGRRLSALQAERESPERAEMLGRRREGIATERLTDEIMEAGRRRPGDQPATATATPAPPPQPEGTDASRIQSDQAVPAEAGLQPEAIETDRGGDVQQAPPGQPAPPPPENLIDPATLALNLESPPAEPPTQAQLEEFPIVDVPVERIQLSKDVPNFKEGADPATGIIPSERLQGKFRPLGVGPIILWERLDGRLEVISGRHRLDLARQNKKPTIKAQILREADGVTRDQAMIVDAEQNIMEGQGSLSDYAQFFRHAKLTEEQARARSLLGRSKQNSGWHLGRNASDDLYSLWRGGKLNDAKSVAIAAAAPGDPDLQRYGIKSALEGASVEQIVARIESARAHQQATPKAVQGGFKDILESTGWKELEEKFNREGDFVAEQRKALKDIVLSRSAVLRRFDVATATGSIQADAQKAEAERAAAQAELERWKDWGLHPDLKAQVDTATGATTTETPKKGQTKAKEPVIAPAPPAVPPHADLITDDTRKSPEQLAEEKRKADQAAAVAAQQNKPLTGAVDTTMILPGTEQAAGEGDIPLLTQPPRPQAPAQGITAALSPEDQAQLKKLQDDLRKKLGGMFTGMDPEIAVIATRITGLYVKAGIKTFGAYARQFKADMPDIWAKIKTYLHGFWNTAAGEYPEIEELSRAEAARQIAAVDAAQPETADETEPSAEISSTEVQAPAGDRGRPDLRGTVGSGDVPTRNRILTARSEWTSEADTAAIPEAVTRHLDTHQRQGVAKAVTAMESTDRSKGGFLLADGTGVGKTRQALAVAKIWADRGHPVVIVTKAEVIKVNWDAGTISGSFKADSAAMELPIQLRKDGKAAPGQTVITTYENMASVAQNMTPNTVLILDEAHAIKNADSNRAMAGFAAAANARAVLFMTATPADKVQHIYYLQRIGILEGKSVEQAYEDLGLQQRTIKRFDRATQKEVPVSIWVIDPKVGELEVLSRLESLMRRMTQNDAMVKREIDMTGVAIEMEGLTMPEEAKGLMQQIVEFFGFGTIEDAQGLMKARVLGHQRRQQETFKIQRVVAATVEELKAGRQVVIFSHRVNESAVKKKVKVRGFGGEVVDEQIIELMRSEGTAKLLRQELERAGITDIVELHGESDMAAPEAMERFQSKQARVIVATIESGGTGINLDDVFGDAPRTMIIVTAPFDAVSNVQAIGRVWRLKTKSLPKVRYIFGDTTVDEWNASIIRSKMTTLGATVSGQVGRMQIEFPEAFGVEDAPVLQAKSDIAPPAGKYDRDSPPPQLEWKPFKTKAGKDKWVAPATKEFWAWWEAVGGKDGARKHGVSASQYQGKWQVWTDLSPDALRKQATLTRPRAVQFGNAVIVEPDQLLDWDKPLSEQSQYIQRAMEKAYPGMMERAGAVGTLSQQFPYGIQRAHSENLRSGGIRGIRYLDQGSRFGGAAKYEALWAADGKTVEVFERQGGATRVPIKTFATFKEADQWIANNADPATYNYVIFDENDIQITHENGQPVSLREAMLSLATRPPTELLTSGPQTAQGIYEIRQLARVANLPPFARQVIEAMLDTPVMQNLDWGRLTLVLRQQIDGGYAGTSVILDDLIELSSTLDAETFPHEVFHFLFELLPTDDRLAVDRFRREAVTRELQRTDLTPPERALLERMNRGETLFSDDYDTELRAEFYRLINPSEFMAHMASETFVAEQFEARNRSALASLVARIKGWVQGVIDSFRRVFGADPTMDQLYRELLAGKHDRRTLDTALAFARKRQGALPPEEVDPSLREPEWVATQVHGTEWFVPGRPQNTPESSAEAIAIAQRIFATAGFPVELRTFKDVDGVTKSILFMPKAQTPMNEEGERLADMVKREIDEARVLGMPVRSAMVLNSIVENFDMPNSAITDMAPDVRNALFRIAQSERSYRGRALQALAGFKADLVRVGRNVDVYLMEIVSEQFGGEHIEKMVSAAEQRAREDAGRRIKELLGKVSELEAALAVAGKPGSNVVDTVLAAPVKDWQELYDRLQKALVDAGKSLAEAQHAVTLFRRLADDALQKASEFAKATLLVHATLAEKDILKRKNALKKLKDAIARGKFDAQWVLRELAKDTMPLPNEARVNQIKSWAARVMELEELTAQQIVDAAGNPAALAKAKASREEATLDDRSELLRKIRAAWAGMTRPVNLRPWKFWSSNYRQNNAAFLNELYSANMLFKLSFPFKQVSSVLSQYFFHINTRTIGMALERYHADKSDDRETNFWADVSDTLAASYTALRTSFGDSLTSARSALLGRGRIQNVDALESGIAAFDRISSMTHEMDAQGRRAEAFLLRVARLPQLAYRVAQALDRLQGVPAELQEMRHQTYLGLREMGKSRAEASAQADQIIQGIKADYTMAMAEAKAVRDASGLESTPAQLSEAAHRIARRWGYERMRALQLPADAFHEENIYFRDTIGWNNRETTGVGGVAANIVRGTAQLGERLGVPLAIGRFGNAIGIGVNRVLQFTPFYWMTNNETNDSPWFKTETDRQQRKVEAALGTALGAAIIGLVLSGLLRPRIKAPDDKEERELWEQQGHRPGTVEVNIGGGRFIPISLTTGPFQFLTPYLAAAGTFVDKREERERRQAKLDEEAISKGLAPTTLPPLGVADWMSIVGWSAYQSVMGGRTAAGLIGSITDYGQPNIRKFAASQVSPAITGLPMYQELTRMGGVVLDSKAAGFTDFLVPLPTSDARRVNLLGDPVGTPNDIQRIWQVLLGGTYPGPVDPEAAKSTAAYRSLLESGYRPPSINPNQGYAFDSDYRPLKSSELVRYTQLRGQFLKDELAAAGPGVTESEARRAYQRANVQALAAIGATPARASRTAPRAPAVATLPSLGVLRPSRRSFRQPFSRASRLRRPRIRRPRLSRAGRTRRRRPTFTRLSRAPRLRRAA